MAFNMKEIEAATATMEEKLAGVRLAWLKKSQSFSSCRSPHERSLCLANYVPRWHLKDPYAKTRSYNHNTLCWQHHQSHIYQEGDTLEKLRRRPKRAVREEELLDRTETEDGVVL